MKLTILLVSIVFTLVSCGDGSRRNSSGSSMTPSLPKRDHVEALLVKLPSTSDGSSINPEIRDLLHELDTKTFYGNPEFGKGTWAFPVDTILAEIEVLQKWEGRLADRLSAEESPAIKDDLSIVLDVLRKKINFLEASHKLNNRNWMYDLSTPLYEISSIQENAPEDLIRSVLKNLRANTGFYRAIGRDIRRQIAKGEVFYLAQGTAAGVLFTEGYLEKELDGIANWRPELSMLVDEVKLQLQDFHKELEPFKDRLIEPVKKLAYLDYFKTGVDEKIPQEPEPSPPSKVLIRQDFRYGPELYQLSLELHGMSLPADELQSLGEEGLKSARTEMYSLLHQIKARGLEQGSLREKYSDEEDYLRSTKSLAELIATEIGAKDLVSLPEVPMAYFYNKDDTLRYGMMAVFPSLLPEFQGKPTIIVPDFALSVLGESGFILKGYAHHTMAHEGRPGHELHFRSLSKQQSLARRKFGTSTALLEGWGLYSETIARQLLGNSDEDLVFRFYHAQVMALRSARVVLDVRLNLGTIERDEAIDFLVEEVGVSRGDASAEVDRYLSEPGRDGSYYYGYKRLLQAKEALKLMAGEKFSEKCFNDAVMRVGGVTLANLENKILHTADCVGPRN